MNLSSLIYTVFGSLLTFAFACVAVGRTTTGIALAAVAFLIVWAYETR